MGSLLRRAYGAGPLHLLTLLSCFSLVGYAVTQLIGLPDVPRILVWFIGAIIAHDLVAYPLYSLADRVLRRRLRTPLINYVRVPALASALLFAIYYPGIIRQGQPSLHAASGQNQQPFLGRWLLLTAVVFAVSGIAYAARVIPARHDRD